jgi:GT2 family glycosyltransferase
VEAIRTIVCDLELSAPRLEITGAPHGEAVVLVRLHGRPLAVVRAPVRGGVIDRDTVIREFLERHATAAVPLVAQRAILEGQPPAELDIEALFDRPAAAGSVPLPSVTVAVCTRDRPDNLRRCLDALEALDYPRLDLLVIDNAASSSASEQLVRERHPRVRYIREPRPGLDWARNRAIIESRSDIVAFTDDDAIVDVQWVSALARVFASASDVMAVTGLVLPAELDTPAQRLFEEYGGFGRGVVRRWYRAPAGRPLAMLHGGTGKFGTGANMAFRRSLFDDIGGFDPALDVGTCTNGGGDLDIFFRVLKAGHTLVYEPAAIVRHRHRRDRSGLKAQLANNGVGFYSYLVASARRFTSERIPMLRLGLWWFWWWNVRRLARALLMRERVPIDVIGAELVGSLRGLTRYRRACRQARAVADAHASEPPISPPASRDCARNPKRLPEAIRMIDLTRPLEQITDVSNYERVRAVVSWGALPVGTALIEHHGATVSSLWLQDAISQQLAVESLDAGMRLGPDVLWASMVAGLSTTLRGRLVQPRFNAERRTDVARPMQVSIVVATCDRPQDLERTLRSLVAQRSRHHVEVIVVDNRPASRLTPPVVARFPGVRLIQEARGGLSYARNAGIKAAIGTSRLKADGAATDSTSDVILTTDDDVVCPPDWVDRLTAPFQDPTVMAVTGNVLPLELDCDAQIMFEAYGGLGRGFAAQRVDANWFRRWRRSVPTWELGCTANAAFRMSIFKDPAIGLMDDALGAGTPTGCSEDTYVFYRVLKAGHAIVYDPHAQVWHRHRATMKALRSQIFSYSKGHVAYQLTTWLRDGDRRAIVRLLYELPRIYAGRTWDRLRGRSDYPLSFVGLEILGCLAGPFALWRSRWRVRRLGSSAAIDASETERQIDGSAAA